MVKVYKCIFFPEDTQMAKKYAKYDQHHLSSGNANH